MWEDTLFSIPQPSRKCKLKPVFFQLCFQQKQQKADNPMRMTMAQELMLVKSPEFSVRQDLKLQCENDLKVRKTYLEKDTVKVKSTDCFCEVGEAVFSFIQERK